MERSSQIKYLAFMEEYIRVSGLYSSGTEEDLKKIEHALGIALPACFRELFLRMGWFAFRFNGMSDYSSSRYKEMQRDAREIAADMNSPLATDGNFFVFALHGPHSLFWFFRLDEGDDPPVYRFNEVTGAPEKLEDHLSLYIREQGWYQRFLKESGRS